MATIGRRIWTSPSERARALGFQSKQRTNSLESAFYLSTIDAYLAGSLQPEHVRSILEGLYYPSSREEWMQHYWSANLNETLKTLKPKAFANFFDQHWAVEIINNTSAALQSCPIGVARNGGYFFALYRTGVQMENLPLPCGHLIDPEAIYAACPQREFTLQELDECTNTCPTCNRKVKTTEVLSILNRKTFLPYASQPHVSTATPMAIDIGLQLYCGCQVVESDLQQFCGLVLQSLQCPMCFKKIGPGDYYLVYTIYQTMPINSQYTVPCLDFCHSHIDECVQAVHRLQGCYFCEQCWGYMVHELTPTPENRYPSQRTRCLGCCLLIELNKNQELVHIEHSYPKLENRPQQCSNCGLVKDCFQLITCDHSICNECAVQAYLSEAVACRCGQPLDVNDCCTIRALMDLPLDRDKGERFRVSEHKDERLRVSEHAQIYCRNHGDNTKVPGFMRFSSSSLHEFCFPCVECFYKQFQQTSCDICFKPFTQGDKEEMKPVCAQLAR